MTKTRHVAAVVLTALLVAGVAAASPLPQAGTMAIAVSMDRPSTHYYHVIFRCEGLAQESLDFKLPSWTPGYYKIMDYARNVVNFRADDATGRPLAWEKTAKNTWRVKTGMAPAVSVSYDVYAFAQSVADSYLDDTRGFISPTGVFMHVGGRLQQPVTVSVKPFAAWTSVATGLDPVRGQPHTFFAPDFDTLYDCPILLGNLEILSFSVHGVPHRVAATSLGTVDRRVLEDDLKRIVTAAVAIVGEIPYRHYTFLVIGPGGGGLEHLNSTALTLNPSTLTTPAGYKNYMSFVAHEFFHLYNVKTIRPVALGPFDYDKENYTNMLWVSEGISVYFQDLILFRAGLLSRDELFGAFRKSIARYENIPGRLVQSAVQSSFDTWIQFFSRHENSANTTISYYDKGAALGLLLDLAIRHESRGRSSLEQVMRTLYAQFYKEKKRGFTDAEFREVCESAAGAPLSEIFDVYAATTAEVDYAKYLGYAGLAVDLEPSDLPGAWLGAATQDQGGNTVVSSVEWNSPASQAGLSAQDEIIAVDGARVAPRALDDVLAARKPGETIRVLVSRHGTVREVEVVPGRKTERSFRIAPLPRPTEAQSALLDAWLPVQ